jgi:hypothetical protein
MAVSPLKPTVTSEARQDQHNRAWFQGFGDISACRAEVREEGMMRLAIR